LVAFWLLRRVAGDYQVVFQVSFCFALLGVVILVAFVPGRLSTLDIAPTAMGMGPRRPAPGVRRVTLTAALLGLATVSDAFVYLLAVRRFELAANWLPLLPLGTATAFLLAAPALGRLADRVGPRRVFLAGQVALLAVYLELFFAGGGTAGLVCLLGLHGLWYAATDGVLAAWVGAPGLLGPTAGRPAGRTASALAWAQSGQAAGRLVASVACGLALTTWAATTVLAVAAVALAVALVVALRLTQDGGRA
jgi:predicted MFS family arabinose efflux permease